MTAQLGGGEFLSGATGAGFNEILQKELKKIEDPALHQWASLLVGTIVNKILNGDGTGAITALNGTKYNFLSHWQSNQRDEAIANEDWEKVAYWDLIDKAQNQVCNAMGINPNFINWEDPNNSGLLQTISIQAQQLEADPDFKNSWLVNKPTVDFSILITAGVVGTGVVVSGVMLYNYNGIWVKATPAVGTGTVWDVIKPTANNIPGTAIPATFQIQTAQRLLWTNANATEHMGEYINRFGPQSWSVQMRSQAMLTSFNGAVQEFAAKFANSPAGRYFETIGGWELGINTETGVIFHAMPK